jgi:hypothetical protein
MLHGRLAFTQDRATDVPQRQMYTGAQLKVFNTVPYYGLHLGGTELGGSAFQGSMLSFGYLHRWFSDPLVVVNNDTAEVARHNANVDFFIRSSIVEFFKVITIRGSVLLPMHGRGRIASRIAIAVPVGGVYTF